MDKIEQLIKEYLGRNLHKAEKTDLCLSEQVLLDYFQHKLGPEDSQGIENHLTNCGFCLSQLNLIFEARDIYKRGQGEKVPVEVIQRAKALVNVGAGLVPARIKGRLFLAGAIVFLIASFFIPRYFFQFLVVTLILGMRWAFESKGGRTLIMVLDSWRRHSHDDDDEISHRLKDKFPSIHP